MAFQKLIIEGNLGKDPQIKNFENGSLASFTVAVTERAYQTKSGKQIPEHTEWFNVSVRGGLVQIVQNYLHKGDKVLIEGTLRTREYQDQQGATHSFTEVICDSLDLLTPKNQAAQPQHYQQAPMAQPQQQAPYAYQGTYQQAYNAAQPQQAQPQYQPQYTQQPTNDAPPF